MRLLNEKEIECRVATCTEKGVSLLLYKTARVDRAMLDEEFGSMNWQNDFKTIDGKMYGGIAVYDSNKSQWLWRWDCGVESNTEAEKGQASDCFKRAGFKWGIGVELYSSPFIWVKAEALGDKLKGFNGKFKCSESFEVQTIEYNNDREISGLVIVNSKKEIVYTFGKASPKKKAEPKKVEQKVEPKVEPKVEVAKDIPAELLDVYTKTLPYLKTKKFLDDYSKARLVKLIEDLSQYDKAKSNELQEQLTRINKGE